VDRVNSRLLVRRGDNVLTFAVTEDTLITSNQGSGPTRIELDDVRRGDAVRVRADANGRAIVIRVRNATAGEADGGLRIASVIHDARRPLRVGDTVTVSMHGTPGARATFEILGVADRIPMREVSRGVYQGAYRIRDGDAANNAMIVARLRSSTDEDVASAEGRIIIVR
jgi:hypothetical protein